MRPCESARKIPSLLSSTSLRNRSSAARRRLSIRRRSLTSRSTARIMTGRPASKLQVALPSSSTRPPSAFTNTVSNGGTVSPASSRWKTSRHLSRLDSWMTSKTRSMSMRAAEYPSASRHARFTYAKEPSGRTLCTRSVMLSSSFSICSAGSPAPRKRLTSSWTIANALAYPGTSARRTKISPKSCNLRPLHRALFHRFTQRLVRSTAELADRDAVPVRARLPGGIARHGGGRVPRTYFLADVAAVHVRAHRRVEFRRDVAALLDRQVRDAAVRIDDAGRDDRLRLARLDAERARAALIERRPIAFQIEAADDLGEKDPRALLRVDHARVLADPADAGVLRVDALLHRPRVDVRARIERLRRSRSHPVQQLMHPRADDVVVVAAPRVAGDVRPLFIGDLGRVRAIGVVDRRGDDDRAGGDHDVADVGAAIGGSIEVRHLSGVSSVEPLAEER